MMISVRFSNRFLFSRALRASFSQAHLSYLRPLFWSLTQPSSALSSSSTNTKSYGTLPFAHLTRSTRHSVALVSGNTTVRYFFGWLNAIFNRYDASRVQEVGPDRAAAEWLIRCGAAVQWSQGPAEWFKDYNSLPATYSRSLKITAIDGTDSAVMSIGFKHLDGLTECRSIIFHKATYLEDEAVKQLVYVKNCLKELQISSCGNISEEGLEALTKLTNLEKLVLYDLPEIKNREEWIARLQAALPKCQVEFPYAQATEREKQKLAEQNKK